MYNINNLFERLKTFSQNHFLFLNRKIELPSKFFSNKDTGTVKLSERIYEPIIEKRSKKLFDLLLRESSIGIPTRRTRLDMYYNLVKTENCRKL